MLVKAAVAVGAAAYNGGHGGNSGLDGAVAIHRRYRRALSMLSALGSSHCHGGRCAGHDRGFGRVGVGAPGSGLSRSSGHGGGRSCRGAVRGRRRGSGNRRVLRVRDGITHGLGGGRGGCENAVCNLRNRYLKCGRITLSLESQIRARGLCGINELPGWQTRGAEKRVVGYEEKRSTPCWGRALEAVRALQ